MTTTATFTTSIDGKEASFTPSSNGVEIRVGDAHIANLVLDNGAYMFQIVEQSTPPADVQLTGNFVTLAGPGFYFERV